VRIADLEGLPLGVTTETGVTIDRDAAGWGWFTGESDLALSDRMDLLTVVLHELGHVMGLEHQDASQLVMHPVLVAGSKELPTAIERAPGVASTAGAHASVLLSRKPAVLGGNDSWFLALASTSALSAPLGSPTQPGLPSLRLAPARTRSLSCCANAPSVIRPRRAAARRWARAHAG
jgi:hypothetical protein